MIKNNLKILITGGGSGIGAALAKSLSEDGNTIIICGRRVGKLTEVSKTNNNIFHFPCNVSNEKDVIDFSRIVKEKFEYIDVLINCAGLFGAIGRFDKTDSYMWKKTFEINTFGVYLMVKHFLHLLLKSNVKKIINFAGGGAFGTFPNYSAYATSKAAVVRLTENMAVELADLGVQINCIAPGFINTVISHVVYSTTKKRDIC